MISFVLSYCWDVQCNIVLVCSFLASSYCVICRNTVIDEYALVLNHLCSSGHTCNDRIVLEFVPELFVNVESTVMCMHVLVLPTSFFRLLDY